MIHLPGVSNHYLEIDLSRRSWSVFQLPERDLIQYLGGKGVGLKLFYDRVHDLKGLDPLGEDNLLCFSMGALLGTGASCSARFDGVTKSPLTGIMVTSSCGGPFGEACKTAGWDGVIVRGKAESPILIRIDETGAVFEDADDIWGLEIPEAQRRLSLTPREGELVIGPAGEHQVLFANICSGKRFLGRGGMGAVMGSKNVKAIVARGKSHRIEPVLPKLFDKTQRRAMRYSRRNYMTKRYKAYGTNANIRFSKQYGFAPVNNFRDRYDDRLDEVSGEAMAKKYRTRHAACRYCSVLCGHKGNFPDGKIRHIPEYETVGMFGPNIGNYDTDRIAVWNDLMNRLGMDTITAGSVIGWAMEANERNIRPSELRFNSFGNIEKMLTDIAFRRGEGSELAEGTKRLSSFYGGESFACHVKGLEMAAYDPRASWGQGLTFAVTNRGGCHLGSYMVAPENMLRFLKPQTTRSKAQWVVFFENLYAAVNSLQTCMFTVFSIILEPAAARLTPRPVLAAVMQLAPKAAQSVMNWSILSDYFTAVTGFKLTQRQLLEAGERVQVLERYMNTLMGVTAADDTLPERFLTESETRYYRKSVVDLEPMVRRYYRLRGYTDEGRPSGALLSKLGIEERH